MDADAQIPIHNNIRLEQFCDTFLNTDLSTLPTTQKNPQKTKHMKSNLDLNNSKSEDGLEVIIISEICLDQEASDMTNKVTLNSLGDQSMQNRFGLEQPVCLNYGNRRYTIQKQ